MRKVGKAIKSKLQHEADKLLQRYIVLSYPKCEICGQPTFCGHHFIEKSKSNRLRYEISNLIPVCLSCHCKIHNRFSYSLGAYDIIDLIIKGRGKKWFDKLQKLRHELIKTDEIFYQANIDAYKKEILTLENGL